MTCVLSSLLFVLLFVVPCVLCDLPIQLPTFKDPYNGADAPLLDINILTNQDCLSTISVAVKVPLLLTGLLAPAEGNAHFEGPAFGPRPIVGITTHNNNPVTVDVSWNGIDTLTFTNLGPAALPCDPAACGGTGWMNINFDIPANLFVDPFAQTYSNDYPACASNTPTNCNVPLDFVYDADYVLIDCTILPKPNGCPQTKKIDLTDDSHFDAESTSQQCGGAPPCTGCGDPVFSGFQGQVYQFHGLPDEHFNLVSSPDVLLNSHFVYLSSGKCDYNDTECFTHPGTYMDVLGYSIGETHIKLVAGTHEAGLRIWVNDRELQRGARISSLSTNTTAALRYHHTGRVQIKTQIMSFEIVNSDMFFNIHASLNDQQLLRVGATKHTVTDHNICKTNSETHDHQLIEKTVAKKYPVTTPLHGLIGQTWRNVKVCSRDWMGTVQDYLVSDLFANDNHYNYFKW